MNEKPRKSRMKDYTTAAVRYWMSEQVSLLAKKGPHSILNGRFATSSAEKPGPWQGFFTGRVRSNEVTDQSKPKAQVARGGELGCLRLHYPHIF